MGGFATRSPFRSPSRLRLVPEGILPPRRLLRLDRNPYSASPVRIRHSFAPYAGTGISTCRPSAAPSGSIALGPDLPRADEPSPGNLGLSVCNSAPCISLLTPAFSLPCSPPLLTGTALRARNAPLPLALQCESAASAACLAPVHFRRRATRLVSCYALFKGWLLLRPNLLVVYTCPHPFPLSMHFGALAGDPGCFPLGEDLITRGLTAGYPQTAFGV